MGVKLGVNHKLLLIPPLKRKYTWSGRKYCNSSFYFSIFHCLFGNENAMWYFNREWGMGLEDTLSSWIMVILIFLFMFSIGIAIANFPWVLMGKLENPSTLQC